MNVKTITKIFILSLILGIFYRIIDSSYESLTQNEDYNLSFGILAVLLLVIKIVFFWVFIRYFRPKRALLIISILGIMICSLFRILLNPELGMLAIEETTRIAVKSLFVNLENVFLLVFLGEMVRLISSRLKALKRAVLIAFYTHLTLILLFIIFTFSLMAGYDSNYIISNTNDLRLIFITLDVLAFIWFLNIFSNSYQNLQLN